METSESIKALAPALVEAMGELQNVVADAANPHFRSKYASLPAILDTVRPVLAKHGLSVVQLPVATDGLVGIESLVLHKSGEWLRQSIMVRPQKDDPQGAGSALTYCRRYSLAAILAIGQDDDDGNAASTAPAAKAGPAFGKRSAPAPKPAAAIAPAAPAAATADADPWLDEPLGFGKHADKTWRTMSEGELGSGRANYLDWLLNNASDEATAERARRCLTIISNRTDRAVA